MKKILIANRGEIACRVIRTAHKMGIETVAVYSEADRHAPHVTMAGEAVLIGPAASNQSYLNGERIIEAARVTGAEGIHPGYGFLSENARFARMVETAGLIFIGPGPHAIELMGSKLASKEAIRDFGIPLVPGTEEAISDAAEAKRIAREIGFPILIKASAGGGGKGMRIVHSEADLESQMERAVSEAVSAFGDGSVFIEKYIGNPKHIEIQILADTHGNTLYLFERECSVQRRHQKVVEEAPSAVLSDALRKRMGEDAVKVARACDYVGAGTVEFLYEDGNYYFLEMNTRLQVEHPVTELITGIDLVEQQILIARGQPLSLQQEDVTISGHAVELRVYAEDPLNNFLPSVGTLTRYRRPDGPNVRLDDGYREGMEVPIHYDPMLAKLIAWGHTREAAIRTLSEAIDAYEIEGVATTLPFGKFVLTHEAFLDGSFTTHFVDEHYTPDKLRSSREENARLAALLATSLFEKNHRKLTPIEHAGGRQWWENRK
ncbi:MAG: acetyl-CoA carboxylase biotin carboxylase subunit [Saprospiraceae bacterium]